MQNEALRRKSWGWRKYHLFRPTSTFWTAWSCNRVRMYQELCVSIFFFLIFWLHNYLTNFWCKICSVVVFKSNTKLRRFFIFSCPCDLFCIETYESINIFSYFQSQNRFYQLKKPRSQFPNSIIERFNRLTVKYNVLNIFRILSKLH